MLLDITGRAETKSEVRRYAISWLCGLAISIGLPVIFALDSGISGLLTISLNPKATALSMILSSSSKSSFLLCRVILPFSITGIFS